MKHKHFNLEVVSRWDMLLKHRPWHLLVCRFMCTMLELLHAIMAFFLVLLKIWLGYMVDISWMLKIKDQLTQQSTGQSAGPLSGDLPVDRLSFRLNQFIVHHQI